MASESRATITEEDIQAFDQHLKNFTEGQLRRITEHFHQDLTYVIENDITLVLQELLGRKVITSQQAQTYAEVENHLDSTKAAEKLVDYFLSASTAEAIGLWKSLFVLRSRWSHPNLNGMVEEILRNGQALLEDILLNESGHTLDPEVKGTKKRLTGWRGGKGGGSQTHQIYSETSSFELNMPWPATTTEK